MSARTVMSGAQFLIAAVFCVLGGWALLAPASVIELAVTPAYRDDSFLARFTMACFGAQAVLFGLMTLAVRWQVRGFAVFAALMVPFFLFDWYFHYEVPVLTIIGWRAARAAEQEQVQVQA